MSLIKKLAGDTVIYGISSILPRLLQFLVGMTYITYRFPNQENVGIYNILYAYAALILTILLFRMDTAFFRYGRDKESSKRVFFTALIPVLILSIGTCALVVSNADGLAKAMSYEDSPQYLRWFSYIICFDAIAAMFYARFRLDNRPMRFLVYRIANVLFTILLTLTFLEVFPRIWPEALDFVNRIFTISREIDYVFIANLLASFLVLVAMIPELRRVEFQFDTTVFKKLMNYSWPLVIVGLAGIISQSFSTPLQERWLSEDITYNRAQAGIYGSVAKLALLLNLFIVAFNYAAEPFFFNNSDKKESRDLYGQVALLFTIVICLVSLGIVAYLDWIQFVIGSSYRSGLPIVPYLLFAFIFLGLYYNVSIWFKLSDNTKIGALIAVGGMSIMLGMNYVLLPKLGIVASAYAALACFSFMTTVAWWTGKKYYPIPYPVRSIVQYLGLTAFFVFGLSYLRNHSELPIWIFGSLAIGVYLFTTYIKDGKRLKNMIKGDE
jgi:O-antigen/teichoic acid export membrane protein